MKALLFIILTGIVNSVPAQTVADRKAAIDSQVTIIDNDQLQVAKTFSVPAIKRKQQHIIYRYWLKHGQVTKINRQVKMAKDSVEQVFYFSRQLLIYSTESIRSFDDPKTREVTYLWSGIYYFNNGKLLDLVTLGHGKSETEEWDPEKEVLTNCKAAKAAVKMHRAKKGGSPA